MQTRNLKSKGGVGITLSQSEQLGSKQGYKFFIFAKILFRLQGGLFGKTTLALHPGDKIEKVSKSISQFDD